MTEPDWKSIAVELFKTLEIAEGACMACSYREQHEPPFKPGEARRNLEVVHGVLAKHQDVIRNSSN